MEDFQNPIEKVYYSIKEGTKIWSGTIVRTEKEHWFVMPNCSYVPAGEVRFSVYSTGLKHNMVTRDASSRQRNDDYSVQIHTILGQWKISTWLPNGHNTSLQQFTMHLDTINLERLLQSRHELSRIVGKIKVALIRWRQNRTFSA